MHRMMPTSPPLAAETRPDCTARLDAEGLIASARALREARRAGQPQPVLRGKYIAVLGAGFGAGAELLQAAATELGARVTFVSTGLSATSSDKDIRDVAAMLGRLYDAVECEGLPAGVVQRLGEALKVPLFERLASPAHPTAPLAGWLGPEIVPGENRRCVLQAALIAAIG